MRTLFLLFITIYFVRAFAQTPVIEWENTILTDKTDDLYAMIKSGDGGYILAGSSYGAAGFDKTQTSIHKDYWIVKTDAAGNIVWDKTISGVEEDVLTSIQLTTDGGYIAAGYSNSGIGYDKTEASISGSDFWILKLDADANIEWQRTINETSPQVCNSIKQTSDGGYIACGSSFILDPLRYEDYCIIKLDAAGNTEWLKTMGGDWWDVAHDIIETVDGNYVVSGYSGSDSSADKSETTIDGYDDFWIVKLDTNGNILWENTIGGTKDDYPAAIKQTPDNGFIIGGLSKSDTSADKSQNGYGQSDYWLVKLDENGNVMWDRDYGGSGFEGIGALYVTDEGGFILAGSSSSNSSAVKSENNMGSGFTYDVGDKNR